MQLWRDYQADLDIIDAAFERLRVTLLTLKEFGAPRETLEQEVARVITKTKKNLETVDPLRKRVVHLVRYQAYAKNLKFKEVWRLLYARLREATGFDAIAHGLGKGYKTYLDAAQKQGLLSQMLSLASEM